MILRTTISQSPSLNDLYWVLHSGGCRLPRSPSSPRARGIVEELPHVKVPNHRKLFRALLKSYLAVDT